MVEKSKYPGVRFRERKTEKDGKTKIDKYFFIRYRLNGKDKEEAVGWSYDGMTAQKAAIILSKIKENIRTGNYPQSLAEMRELEEEHKEKRELERQTEAKERISFNDFWEQEYFPKQQLNKKKKSVDSELFLYNKWIKPYIGSQALAKITFKQVESLADQAKKASKSASTIRYILAVFSQVWNLAVLHGVVQGDSPSKMVKKPREDNRRMRFLTYDEARLLLENLKKRSQDTHDAAVLSLFAGLRAGEIHALTWGDINFENGTILIKDPKNTHSRYAYICPEILTVLEQRQQDQAKYELVIPAKNNKVKGWVSSSYKRAIEELGFNNDVSDSRQKVVFHSLRHTFASWLVQKGTPLYTVAELMGHTTLEMTRRYAHLAPDTVRAAAMSLSGVLEQKTAKVIPFHRTN